MREEEITQDIYFAMIDAGYTREEADKLCNKKAARFIYSLAEKQAENTLKAILYVDFKDFKDLLLETMNESWEEEQKGQTINDIRKKMADLRRNQ